MWHIFQFLLLPFCFVSGDELSLKDATSPTYWLSRSIFSNFTANNLYFWNHYAFCNHFSRSFSPSNCTAYWDARTDAHFSPVWHASDLSDGSDIGFLQTNINEENPLRCHLIELVRDVWGSSPMYIYYAQKLAARPHVVGIQINGTRNITFYTQMTSDTYFTCGKFLKYSLPVQAFALWEKSAAPTDDYDYSAFYSDFSDYPDSSDSSPPTLPTARTESTTEPPYRTCMSNQAITCKPEFQKPNRTLPSPWGIFCDFIDKSLTQKIQAFYPNKTIYVSCVANFPNLPIYGSFRPFTLAPDDRPYAQHFHTNFSLLITNSSYLPINQWWEVMRLGTQTWCTPLVITDPVPQPFPSFNPPHESTRTPDLTGTQALRQFLCVRSLFLWHETPKSTDMGWICFPFEFQYHCDLLPSQPRYAPDYTMPVYGPGGEETWTTFRLSRNFCQAPPWRVLNDIFNFTFSLYNYANWYTKPMWNQSHLYLNPNRPVSWSNAYTISDAHFAETHVTIPYRWNLTDILSPDASNVVNVTQRLPFLIWTNLSRVNVNFGFTCFQECDEHLPHWVPVANISKSSVQYLWANYSTMAVERAGRKPVSSHPRFWKRCDWGPFSMKRVSAKHRSLLYNVSYFDLPMDISTHVTNITYAIRANYPRKLSPAVTLYDYHPPSLNEVVLTVNSKLAAYMPTQTNCPNDFDITDAVVRYPLVPEADHHTVHWWLYQGMNFDNFTHVRWVGSLPYYTYMLLPGPDNEWAMYDIISHNILKNHTDVVDNSFVYPVFEYRMNFDTCGTKSPLDPCLIDRGGFNETHRWVTAHYPSAVVNPPVVPAMTISAPGILPVVSRPHRILIKPSITPMHIRLSLTSFASTDLSSLQCDKRYFALPTLYHAARGGNSGRRLLQVAEIGAFLVGTALGALIAGAMTEELQVQITSLRHLQNEQFRAVQAISNNLHAVAVTLDKMHAEQQSFKEGMNILFKKQLEDEKIVAQEVSQILHRQECLHAQLMLQAAFNDLKMLFNTGVGRDTRSGITVLDPTKESSCVDGFCDLYMADFHFIGCSGF